MCFILVADMHNENIPELDKFRALQSRSQITFSADGAPKVQDEYVETQYYRELHSIDKQHHTTGSGFIRGVGAEGEGGHEVLKLQNGQDGAGLCLLKTKSERELLDVSVGGSFRERDLAPTFPVNFFN
ncbi:hypothetical protein CIPAW_05G115900 [Carya illinoinensis]|uniref:Uncharacterized protein n=1 Tax=Carya illinoinensis TaxID=32201 RepID=A0A8T1QIH3_CARIL|nr:hypothetical protein CIPAW_05G115900 [Carya illinoinensis]